MNSEKKTTITLEDVRLKLSALWIALMFIYLYNDFFEITRPGYMDELIAGNIAPSLMVQIEYFAYMMIMAIPSLMIFLSLTLKPKVNCWTNIIVGVLYTALQIWTIVGESWAFYIFGVIIEVVLTATIVWYAWKWKKQEA